MRTSARRRHRAGVLVASLVASSVVVIGCDRPPRADSPALRHVEAQLQSELRTRWVRVGVRSRDTLVVALTAGRFISEGAVPREPQRRMIARRAIHLLSPDPAQLGPIRHVTMQVSSARGLGPLRFGGTTWRSTFLVDSLLAVPAPDSMVPLRVPSDSARRDE